MALGFDAEDAAKPIQSSPHSEDRTAYPQGAVLFCALGPVAPKGDCPLPHIRISLCLLQAPSRSDKA